MCGKVAAYKQITIRWQMTSKMTMSCGGLSEHRNFDVSEIEREERKKLNYRC